MTVLVKLKAVSVQLKAVFILLIGLMVAGAGQAQDIIRIAIVGIEADGRAFRISEQLMFAIADKLKVTIQLMVLPPKRATLWLQNGKIHGEMARLASYSTMVPSLIQVTEPIGLTSFYAYTKLNSVHIEDINSLKNFKLVTIKGLALNEVELKDFNKYEVATTVDAFRFLKAGRAQFFISSPTAADEALRDSQFRNSGFHRMEPAIATWHTYSFFAKEHQALAKRYNTALRELKLNGQFQKIVISTQ